MKRKYDLIFGLGPACSCTQTIRRAGLQLLSFPFDWIGPKTDTPEYDSDVRRRVDFICAGFAGWFKSGDFECLGDISSTGKACCFNRDLKLLFIHDFPIGRPIEESFDGILGKYRRRIARFQELLASARHVLVVRIDRPDLPARTPLDDCRYARQELAKHFPNAAFDMLLLQPDSGIPFERLKFETLEPGLMRMSFDYADRTPGMPSYQIQLDKTGKALAALYSIRDYRTQAERAAHERRKELARFERAGVSSRREYLALKWRKSVLGRLLPVLAGLRRKKFTHIMPLGINCEAAFWFNRIWGFVESSLFAWALTHNLDSLTKTLSRFDDILSGTATFDERSFMWKCDRTGIYFHGRFKRLPQSPLPDAAALEADLADLRGRIAHLKEKFRRYLSDTDSTLFVYRIGDKDTLSGLAGERLDALEAALSRFGARNWKLLVVCEKANRARVPAGPNRLIRTVSRFNSTACVTDERKGDEAGWKTIYSEFAPDKILPKAHKFKFE